MNDYMDKYYASFNKADEEKRNDLKLRAYVGLIRLDNVIGHYAKDVYDNFLTFNDYVGFIEYCVINTCTELYPNYLEYCEKKGFHPADIVLFVCKMYVKDIIERKNHKLISEATDIWLEKHSTVSWENEKLCSAVISYFDDCICDNIGI